MVPGEQDPEARGGVDKVSLGFFQLVSFASRARI